MSDLVGNHSTVARQNGWPGGDKERMEHGAGCMEYKDGDQRSFATKLAHRPRPLPTVRSVILPKEETKTQRLLNNSGQTTEVRGQQGRDERSEIGDWRSEVSKDANLEGANR